jgi:hypothetical protein
MPSKSKAQQRLMGAAYAAKKNKTPLKELSPELQKLVKSMKQDLKTLSVLNPELQINGIELDKKKNKDKQIEYDD